MRAKYLWTFLAMTAVIGCAGGGTTFLTTNLIRVVAAALNGWQRTQSGTASGAFVTGPGTPPIGSGSYEFTQGSDGNSDAQLRFTGLHGVKLNTIRELWYSTYVVQDGSGGQAPYLILNLDLDNDGDVDDLIFFEPAYQSAAFYPQDPQPALVVGAWQEWDARHGGWWSLNSIGGATPGAGVKSLGAYLAAAGPDATIVNGTTGTGGARIVIGFGAGAWDNFIGNADRFIYKLNGEAITTTYDFEPG